MGRHSLIERESRVLSDAEVYDQDLAIPIGARVLTAEIVEASIQQLAVQQAVAASVELNPAVT